MTGMENGSRKNSCMRPSRGEQGSMSIEELRKKFIVDEDAIKSKLEPLVTKALAHCQIDKNGHVLIYDSKLSGREQVMLVLAARLIASELDQNIPAEVSVGELEKDTGLPSNQIRARGNEVIKAKFALSPRAGVYKALPHKIEAFLDGISKDKSG